MMLLQNQSQSYSSCYHLLNFIVIAISLLCTVNCKSKTEVRIGVILDIDSSIGKMSKTTISMAIHDFYTKHDNYTTVIIPFFRDSKQDNVQAASAAIDLLKNTRVTAILGPVTSSQADFVIDIGRKSKVPVISPATSPSLSPNENEYFIRSAYSSTSQINPIADVIKHFNWSEIVFVYEDGVYGRGLVSYFCDAMENIGIKVTYQVIYASDSDDRILAQLYKLQTMQTRVFVVHLLPDTASRFFKKVHEAGMMEEGYVWIVTEELASRLNRLDHINESIQGVLGVKSYIRRFDELIDFEKRWKREFRCRYPEDDTTKLDASGIRLYDTVFGLAIALEKITLDHEIGSLEAQTGLVSLIRNMRFDGLGGEFHVINGELQSSVYEIVNKIGTGEKIIGFWSCENGITANLKAVIWPGDSHVIPRGWEIPTSNKSMLKVGIPANAFDKFINVNSFDPQTGKVIMSGFCVDVFNAVIDALPYAVKHKFIPFVTSDGKTPAGSYNDLLHNLSNGGYDAVAGDITVLANRSDVVSFTLPYIDAGVSLIVKLKDERKSAWIFMKPLEKDLWITIGAFFIYTGFAVWVFEHRVNQEFRGPAHKQVGMLLWFSFSTVVYAHREKLISNLSRFVVIVWVFVVLVLTSSYTASLTSMLTVPQLQPMYSDIYEIMKNGEVVGYQDGSFVRDRLKDLGFNDRQLKNFRTFEEYENALRLGSEKGGVSAIMVEVPYIRVFLAKYCTDYRMTGPIYKTGGFAFAFPLGSPLVNDVSKAILQVTETQMTEITNRWFRQEAICGEQKGRLDSTGLGLDSFKGVFMIAGLSSTSALLVFSIMFLYQHRQTLMSQDSVSRKLVVIARTFDVFKDDHDESRKSNPEVIQVISHDEGFSGTEPGTPDDHEVIQDAEETITN